MDAIRYALDGIPSRQKLLLIDTCQSGENPALFGYKVSDKRLKSIRQSRGRKKATEKGIKYVRRGKYNKRGIAVTTAYTLDMKEMSELFPELRGTGTIEISAATRVQSALESTEWKNGAFTFAIKEAVLKGKARKDGAITAQSLRKYVLDRVEELTEGEQTPMVSRDISGRDFVILK